MKREKRKRHVIFASILLCVIMLCSNITPVSAASDLVYGNNGTLTRAEWLHNLATVFEMSVDDETYPDNYFSDLSSDSKYYQDILLTVQFGVVNVEAGDPIYPDKTVTREFAAQTLNFCLGFQLEEKKYTFSDSKDCIYADDLQIAVNRNWFALVNGKVLPNQNITSNETKTMLDDATAVLAETKVEENYDNEYVIADGIKEVAKGTFVERIGENTIQITDCPVTINTGDKFVVYFDEVAAGYLAEKVTTAENITTIQIKDLENTEVFESIDAQGVIDADLTQMAAAEGADIVFIDEATGQTYTDARAAMRATIPINRTIKVKRSIKLGESVNANVTVTIKNPKVEYKINLKKGDVYAKLIGNSEISYGIEFNSSGLEKINDVNLIDCTVPGIGGFSITTDLEASGEAAGVTKGKMTAGIGYTVGKGFRLIKGFEAQGFSNRVQGVAGVGLRMRFGITEMPDDVLYGYVYASAGGRASAEINSYNDNKKPQTCAHYAAYIYAEAGATAGVNIGFYEKEITIEREIFSEDNSPVRVVHHYEDGTEVPSCTRGLVWGKGYYTPWDSPYGGCGWSGSNGSGLDAEGKPYAIYEYSLNKDDDAVITKYRGNMRALVIPDTLDGHRVVSIGHKSFADNQYLNSVIIPDSVTTIASGAFGRCINLSEVTLSSNLLQMDTHAFFNCDKLQYIEIPKSLEKSESAYIPEYVYDYQVGPFYGCDGLKQVFIEPGTTKIVEGLFANCPGLQSVSIPDTVTEIGYKAFAWAENLAAVKFGNSLTKIDGEAFRNTAVTELNISDSVTNIDGGAFAKCAELTSVHLPKSLVRMDAHAFFDCDKLTSIEIPKYLEKSEEVYIYEFAYGYQPGPFFNCDGLETVTFEDGIKQIAPRLFANCPGIKNVTIPDTVTKIDYKAFAWAENLTEVKLGNSLTSIGGEAFRNTGITNLDISNSVTTINGGAFAKCAELASLKLPKNLKQLDAHAFFDCDKLASVEIPKNLSKSAEVYIYEFAYGYQPGPFFNCDGLKTVTFEEGTTKVIYGLFANCPGLENIELPDTIVKLEDRAFAKSGLSSIVFNETLKEIGTSAFEFTKLKEVELPASITKTGTYVFNECKELTSLKVNGNLEQISDRICNKCTSLTNVTVPKTVRIIGDSAFRECTSLETITLPENLERISAFAFAKTGLKEIAIPEGCRAIWDSAFRSCPQLEKVVVPTSINELVDYAFADNEKLKEVKLGAGTAIIPQYCFANCPALETILLPYTVTKVEAHAFENDTALTSITIPKATTSIGEQAFSYPDKTTIYGVKGSYAETYAKEKGFTFVENTANATKVTLNKTELTINNGKTEQLVMTVEPSNFTDDVNWKSSNTSVATVNNKGLIKAVAPGTATIKLTVGDTSASCTVTVLQPVNYISLSPTVLNLKAGEEKTIEAYVSPNNASNKEIEWSSSNPEIATVNSEGKVTALKKGNAVITAAALDGSGKTATCNVTVLNTIYQASSVEELESVHNYETNCSDYWTYTLKGAENLKVTFDERTAVEDGFDYIYLYHADGTQAGKYTGTELAGKTVTVKGDTVKIQLVTDNGGNAWGFKVTEVTASGVSVEKLPQILEGTDTYKKTTNDGNFTLDTVLTSGNGKLSYASDNENVASVDNNGNVTIHGAGTAIIQITVAETDEYKATKKQVTIIVTKSIAGWVVTDGKWQYRDENGNFAVNTWKDIDGARYYFNQNGYMVSGWNSIDGNWYYFNNSGAMMTGIQFISGSYYGLASDGRMLTGWNIFDEIWYYFNPDGTAVHGWNSINGNWYFFDSEAKMLTGIQNISGTYYGFDNSGAMMTGWGSINGNWYFFDTSGAAVHGWNSIYGAWYFFDDKAKMLTGIQNISGTYYGFDNSGAMMTGWGNINSTWYYFNSSGAAVHGWNSIGGAWYFFDSEAKMLEKEWLDNTYYFTEGGSMAIGWLQIDGFYYYFAGSGEKVCNTWIGDYYLKEDGKMAVNEWVDGGKYYVDHNGVWDPTK